ncbi:NAD(P)/FAD-dependent oxidoreductase [Paraclostridium bifermentans]|uniref:NAD(P)/FAD-dependent oxidoreductase n=1 Tax=Paraclostridium bifermentans TaxID=1490 RepID=UPI001C80D89C|nr:FAD-binding oxidoreductase [Paraclostridium bifermentans]GIM33359.1 oxidoreductase [Paraclostridium bifermentans subsp. muricolitidis]
MSIPYVQGEPLFTSINKNKNQYPYLTEDLETDICIIGGGVTGAIASYYFSKNNVNTVLLEKKRIAHLSTSVTTSLLQYELDDNISDLKEYTTLENALRSYKLGIKALKEIEEFINEYGNKCDYKKRNTLLYTSKKDEINGIKIEYDYRKENGLDVEYIDSDSNKFSFDLKAGIISNNGGAELDPYKYTSQLLDVSCSMDSKIYENTKVIDVVHNDDYIEVITEFGYKVKAKKVIVATGYNTRLFTNRNFGTKTTTFNIVSKPVSNFNGWEDKILIRDNSDPYNYLRTTADNRLIIGGEDVSFIPDIFDEKLANKKYDILECRLKSMFKEIDNIEIDFKYCGTFTSTPDNLGFVGPDNKHKNLWYLLGYGANGILFAILGAMMLTELYNGEYNKDLGLFKIDRFDN